MTVARTESGARVLRSGVPLRPYPARVTDDLLRWAQAAPGTAFLAERDGERWRTITFAAMLERVRRIGAALLAAGGSPERPLAVVAENGIDHAAVVLGAIYAGIPASPLSTGYLRADADPARLQALIGVLQPFAAFVPDAPSAARFAAAVPYVPVLRDAATLDGDPAAAGRAHAA
ncbi:MAG TPA: AMP-binding protein, partial [Dongiaceae bacterium]|nr:AMP-binding protein [Dongiaceae bacterium]